MAAPPAIGLTRGGRWRLPLLLVVVAVVIVAALVVVGLRGEPERGVEVGLVTAIRDVSLTEVDGFTLRTSDGRILEFRIGRLRLDGGGFPAGHLREHLALAQPVEVSWERVDGELVAHKLEDAFPAGS